MPSCQTVNARKQQIIHSELTLALAKMFDGVCLQHVATSTIHTCLCASPVRPLLNWFQLQTWLKLHCNLTANPKRLFLPWPLTTKIANNHAQRIRLQANISPTLLSKVRSAFFSNKYCTTLTWFPKAAAWSGKLPHCIQEMMSLDRHSHVTYSQLYIRFDDGRSDAWTKEKCDYHLNTHRFCCRS